MIGGVAPWFGGKRTLASDIVAEIGPRQAYWEPFCGSCAVLFALHPEGAETVNDLHGQLTHCLRVLADPDDAQELYRQLAGVVASEGLWKDAQATCRDTEPPTGFRSPKLAAQWLLFNWLAYGGQSGRNGYGHGFGVNFSQNATTQPHRWGCVVESIPEWHKRLRNVMVLQRDAFDVLAKIRDERGTVIYCDPPYLAKTRQYTHDLDISQHEQLAGLLNRFKRARVLLSYYDDPRLAEWYPDWTRRDFARTAIASSRVKHKRGEKQAISPEVLLINGPSYVEAPSLWPL